MTLGVAAFNPDQEDRWNRLVEASNEGTLFHRLDFLAYHGDRFRAREAHVGIYQGEQLAGVMPLALFEAGGALEARSPYGASYGGPVFLRPPGYAEAAAFWEALRAHLEARGVRLLRMTLPIAPCYRTPCDTLRFALLEAGAVCAARELSSVVSLQGHADPAALVGARVRRAARKAEKHGVRICRRGPLAAFWAVLEATFAKHGAAPTHSFEEFRWLAERFPGQVRADVACLGDTPVAGVGYLASNPRVDATFYLAQDPAFQDSQALTLLILDGIGQALASGYRHLDLGTSTMAMRARPNVFEFKEGFGVTGAFRETYVWQW